jgi:ubiquinone/menaquinone biosynthesis C-methylase UbiE
MTIFLTICFWALIAGIFFIIYTDGAHFGKRVVRGFYTFYAPIYDRAKPLTWVRNRTIRRILREHVLPTTGTHLDVATGTGRVIRLLLSEPGWTGTHIGIDYTPRMLAIARKSTPQGAMTVQYILGDANEVELKEQFTLVTCLEALELFEDPSDALRRLLRHAQPGGYILITKMREYLVPTIPKKSINRKMLESICSEEGATIVLYRHEFNTRYELCLMKKK